MSWICSMCRAGSGPACRSSDASTCAVSSATTWCTREDAAASPPSTARNALVSATEILLASKGETDPSRRMTRTAIGVVSPDEGGR